MKKTLKLALLLLGLLLTPVMWGCDDDEDDFRQELVSYDKLPLPAQSFVSQFYPGVNVLRVEKDYDDGVVVYEVTFSNGHEVTFDSDGNWVEVDAPDGMSIPDGIVPMTIQQYLDTNYPNYGVNDLSKTAFGYEVELTTGLDLMFDRVGNFIGIN